MKIFFKENKKVEENEIDLANLYNYYSINKKPYYLTKFSQELSISRDLIRNKLKKKDIDFNVKENIFEKVDDEKEKKIKEIIIDSSFQENNEVIGNTHTNIWEKNIENQLSNIFEQLTILSQKLNQNENKYEMIDNKVTEL